MSMNRRSVLLGLGTAAAGSGVVFGSGAFTQTSADRDVDLAFADDDKAALALAEGANSTDSDTEANVSKDGSAGAEKITIDIGEEGMVTDGVNLFTDILKVTNNGEDNVFLHTQVNSDNQSRAARVRVLAPVNGLSGGTDGVAVATNGGQIDDDISDAGGSGHIDQAEAVDISQPAGFTTGDASNGPSFRDNYRLALLPGDKDFYQTGVVELKSGESVNLSIEVEAGPKTGGGGTESSGVFTFSGEYRFAARDINQFNGSDVQTTESNFFNSNNNLDGF